MSKSYTSPRSGVGFDAPTTGSSEGDPTPAVTPAAGAPAEGEPGGSQAAEQFAAERERLESERRALQSEKDRLAAELKALKDQATPPAPKSDEQPAPLTQEGILSLLRRDRELTAAAASLKDEFTLADPAIFSDYEKFESAAALRAAAEDSHNRLKTVLDQHTAPAVEAALKPYVEKYGQLAQTPPDNAGGSNTGLPSLQEVQAMNQSQLDALVKQHGDDVIDRVLRSATSQ